MKQQIFLVICRYDQYEDGHAIMALETEAAAKAFIVEQSLKDQQAEERDGYYGYREHYLYHVQPVILQRKA
jgi:hypothetical protein